jgi:AraC family transcriptional regulator
MTQVQPLAARHTLSPDVSAALNGLLAEALLALGDGGSGADLSIRLAAGLLQTLGPPQGAIGALAPWQCVKVRRHVDENLASRLSTLDLARLARLSASHFARAFKVSFGRAPHAYIISRRVARAQRLLLTTDLPLCEIALICGMADQAHLSRLFRRATGQPPSAWRRQYASPLDSAA